ncbi:MAG: glycosyltransferase [Acetobacteraceae bacterium]|nr:glycosyltransferase [Acetobacteraceae bacterium]
MTICERSRALVLSEAVHAVTIIVESQVAAARVLARSFRAHHADGRFTAIVLDDTTRLDPDLEPFEFLGSDDLHVPPRLSARLDDLGPAKLGQLAKPWVMQHLIRHGPESVVVYLDPDTLIYGPLTELESAARDHAAVLVPWLTQPLPRDGRRPTALELRSWGVFNPGILALSAADNVEEILRWWRRAASEIDGSPGSGPSSIDFLAALQPVAVMRDPGYGVGYWNLHYRTVVRSDGGYQVASRPLRVFQFRGYDVSAPHHLSQEQNRTQLFRAPVIRELCDCYRRDLLDAGYEEARRTGPSHAGGGKGRQAPHPTGDRIRRRSFGQRVVDLENLLADLRTSDAGQLATARRLAAALNPFPPVRLDRTLGRKRHSTVINAPLGVNVVGYLNGEVGIGEMARQVSGALTACGVPVLPLGIPALHSRNRHQYRTAGLAEGRHPINVVCFNADMFPAFRRSTGEAFFRDRVTIGFWQWEVSAFPEQFVPAFACVDEVWTCSQHTADALAGRSDTPVHHIRIPVVPDPPSPIDQRALKLPDGYVFLFLFDHISVLERKNPLALIQAFTETFRPRSGATLVIKVINAEQRPHDHALLLDEARGHPHVQVREGYLLPGEKNQLIAACDCYVSLHRAEGFGLTLAEAMYFARPVIATGYSGNLDFMTPENSYLVDYDLTPIGSGADPYPAEGEWAEPDLEHAGRLMREVFDQREASRATGTRAAEAIRRTHCRQAAGETMRRRLEHIVEVSRARGSA